MTDDNPLRPDAPAYLALASTISAVFLVYVAVQISELDPISCAVGDATISGATGAASWAPERLGNGDTAP